MKILIKSVEWWPVYKEAEEDYEEGSVEVEMSSELHKRMKMAFDEFDAVRDILQKLYNEAGGI